MTKRRSDGSRRRTTSGGGISCRLRIEPLEVRRLLAGLQVSVFVDQDGSRTFDPAVEVAAVDRLVFLDLDKSGSHDFGEPIQITDGDGAAFFDGLDVGDYQVGLLGNPNSQRQTTSTRVAQRAVQESSTNSSQLFALADLTQGWSIDRNGVATRLQNADISSPDDPVAVDFGGPIRGSLQDQELVWLIVDQSGDSTTEDTGSSIIQFNLATGEQNELTGLESDITVKQFVETSASRLMLFESDGQSRMAEVRLDDGVLEVGDSVAFESEKVVGSPVHDRLASVRDRGNGLSEIELHFSLDTEGYPTSVLIDGVVDSLTFSSDGARLFATMRNGGVNVLRVSGDGQLSLEAMLADATGPVVAMASDNRIISGSSREKGQIIVWDASHWLPIGTSSLGSDAEINAIVTDIFGDQALVAVGDGVYSLDLAIPEPTEISLSRDDQVRSLQLGVRLTGSNDLPDLESFPAREIAEDVGDVFALNEDSGVVDPDGDSLWFTMMIPPAHGSLEMLDDGTWSYVPDANFFGDDSATLLVHDGMASTELQLHWQIAPVNDPPMSIRWQFPSIAENPTPNLALGFLAVVDPDPDAEYRITTSDPRFTVSGGQLLFHEGELDYETEPNVVFDIVATDVKNSEFEIATKVTLSITNVNEPPTGIRLARQTVSENDGGATISAVTVLDPDSVANYEFTVSDERFEIRDGVLRLVPGQTIDYEAEQSLTLTITAREVDGEDRKEIAETITITVNDINEPPTSLILVGSTIEGNTRGAVVGKVAVNDPDGDTFIYEVSDPRLVVVDGILKLREDSQIDYDRESGLTVVIRATSPSGDSIDGRFPIRILPPTSPHRNPRNPNDVNGDGLVTPLDALILINDLNNGGGGPLPTIDVGGSGEPSPIMPDVNGDGSLTPMDVLLIINELNSQDPPRAEGEGAAVRSDLSVQIDAEEIRKRQNSQIDVELESLLEQLSRQRLGNS